MIRMIKKDGYLGSLVLEESCNSSSHSVLHTPHCSADTPEKIFIMIHERFQEVQYFMGICPIAVVPWSMRTKIDHLMGFC